jgi:hypothetical protein
MTEAKPAMNVKVAMRMDIQGKLRTDYHTQIFVQSSPAE